MKSSSPPLLLDRFLDSGVLRFSSMRRVKVEVALLLGRQYLDKERVRFDVVVPVFQGFPYP